MTKERVHNGMGVLYEPEPNTGCWLWLWAVHSEGYGYVRIGKRGTRVHRVMYEHHSGDIPDGLCVCHKCDVRSCVNPAHLFLGTVGDNNRDMTEKGRRAKGEAMGSAKLTERDVRQIRVLLAEGKVQEAIARRYKVTHQNISAIATKRSWAWLA